MTGKRHAEGLANEKIDYKLYRYKKANRDLMCAFAQGGLSRLTRVSSKNPLLALELLLFNGEGMLEQVLLLLHVTALQTSGDTGAGVSASIKHVSPVVVLGFVEQSLDAGLGETPSACVQGLLLCPDNVLCVGIRVEVLLELLPREGVELFDTGDGCVGEVVLLAVLDKGSIGLTGAEDDTLNLLLWLDLELRGLVSSVFNDPLEVRVTGEVLDG